MPDSDLMTIREIADLLGVRPATISGYRSKGVMPDPDDIVLGHPLWRRDTITQWVASRPGQGARTDLRPDRS